MEFSVVNQECSHNSASQWLDLLLSNGVSVDCRYAVNTPPGDHDQTIYYNCRHECKFDTDTRQIQHNNLPCLKQIVETDPDWQNTVAAPADV